MKRISCFTDCLGSGGAQRQLVGLACLLKERGFDVSVVVYYDIPFYKKLLDDAQIPYVVVGNTGNPIKRIWSLYRYWKNNPADVVIAYQETPSLIACLLRPFMKWKKLIVSERNTTQKITLKDKFRFWLWRLVDVIVPNSYAQTKFIMENRPNYTHKVVTITNFTDTDHFMPAEEQTMHHPNPVIAVVASWKPEKNYRRFVEAISSLKQQGYKFHVNWYGIADLYLASHRQILHEFGVETCMTVYPMQLNIRERLIESDFFVLPSLFEGFPNALCEAMSCGLPVACSNVCDNPMIVQNQINGYLFNPLNVNEIAEAIKQLLILSEEEYISISRANRMYAEKELSRSSFVEKYIKILS